MVLLDNKMDEKDERILNFINNFFDDNYRAPSSREIEEEIGISHQTVQRRLLKMHVAKKIKYDGKLGIVITPHMEGIMERGEDVVKLDILGQIACGTPEDITECCLGSVYFPKAFLGTGDYFVLKASGGSMVDAGISNGDYVVVRRTCEANENDIVAAMNEHNETTLKTLKYNKQKACYYLHPEAEGYKDIYPDDIDVIGVATKVIKNL